MAGEVESIMNDIFGSESYGNTSVADEASDAGTPLENGVEDEESSHGDDTYEEMVENGPQVGMKFESMENMLAAYQAFGKNKGFCVAIRNSRFDKYCMICCDRGRKSDEAKKTTKRVNCPARISAIRQPTGCWMVSKVSTDHSHELDPEMSPFMAGHRFMTTTMKRQLEAFDIAGLRACKNRRVLEVQAGGPQNVPCSAKDCRNFIDKRRRLRLGEGDAEAMKQLFTRLQQKDRSFFYLMDIDDQGRLLNVMWIHPRSRAAYEDFHDVVSFDTTYLVNKYQMPFATVVGVNHHNQSILLGCALLSHEHADSFKWFFSNWMQAMGGVYPTAILTDQCESIKIAIREIMPHTIHRFCLWHILCKLPVKFKGINPYNKAVDDFNSMIYNSLSIQEFEENWEVFLTRYGVQDNRWLRDLYAERESWVPVYLNHIFWAGMQSTQRSESMHAFFDGYITSTSTLKMFVEQYEIAITDKVRREQEQDYKSKCILKKFISRFSWEEPLGKVYTNNIMHLFQEEIKKLLSCNATAIVEPNDHNITGFERYEVHELGIIDNHFHKHYKYVVEYRSHGDYFDCQCRKFQSRGILCCHILKVMVSKDIRMVNDRYILRRWRKDVYRPHSRMTFAGAYPHMTEEYKTYQDVERVFQECIEIAFDSPQKIKFVKEKCLQMKDELRAMPHCDDGIGTNPISETTHDPICEETCDRLLDPPICKSRGRPKSTRHKNPGEPIANGSGGRGTRGGLTNGSGGRGTRGTASRGTSSGPQRPPINLNHMPRGRRVRDFESIGGTQGSRT